MISKNKRLTGIVIAVALLLLLPLIAMQFTAEVDWNLFDFVVMGLLLLSTGFMCEFVLRQVKNNDYRIGLIAIVLLVFFLIWAELAVGIFGTPFAGS